MGGIISHFVIVTYYSNLLGLLADGLWWPLVLLLLLLPGTCRAIPASLMFDVPPVIPRCWVIVGDTGAFGVSVSVPVVVGASVTNNRLIIAPQDSDWVSIAIYITKWSIFLLVFAASMTLRDREKDCLLWSWWMEYAPYDHWHSAVYPIGIVIVDVPQSAAIVVVLIQWIHLLFLIAYLDLFLLLHT